MPGKRYAPPWIKMDKRVTLRRYLGDEFDQDTRGQPSGDWADWVTVWAGIEPIGQTTAEFAHQLYPEATHRVTIGYLTGAALPLVVRYGGRYFWVGSISNRFERNHTLDLLCKEAV